MRFVVKVYRWIFENELVTVGLLFVIAFGTWSFVSIADEVFEGDSRAIDERILLSKRTTSDPSDSIGPSWFEETARDVIALESLAALMIFSAYFSKQPWIALFVVVTVVSGTAASSVMKSGFHRPRPELVPHETRIYTKSFPSGHSSMSSLVYLTLGAVMSRAEQRRKAKVFLLAVAVFLLLIVDLSRVYLGVHWPTDVLAGWLFGMTWAAASWFVFQVLAAVSTARSVTTGAVAIASN